MINAVALRLQLMRHMAVTAAPITVYSRGYDKSTYRVLRCRAFSPATDCFVIGNIKPGSGHSRGERIQESRAAWRYEREYYFTNIAYRQKRTVVILTGTRGLA